MRKLMIRFNKDGEFFRELDEERHYFLLEAEEVVMKIRQRLKQEKRVAEPKPFECFIDGERIIITHVSFEKEETLEKQLESTMLSFEGWQKEVRYLYINKLKAYAEEERQLLVNREFKAFAIRFDQVLGHPTMDPAPLLLDIDELKRLFDEVYATVSAGFYSELEEIMSSIQAAYQTVFSRIDQAENQTSRDMIDSWFNQEEHIQKFIQYVAASYQSVPKKRIDALFSRFTPYQKLEHYLFEEFAEQNGFLKAYDLHIEMKDRFYRKFEDILFEGFVLQTDEMIESLVFIPVIQDIQEKIQKDSKKVRERAEEEQATVS